MSRIKKSVSLVLLFAFLLANSVVFDRVHAQEASESSANTEVAAVESEAPDAGNYEVAETGPVSDSVAVEAVRGEDIELRAAAAAAPAISTAEPGEHPVKPGDVYLYKWADKVKGELNTWEVHLRVEAMNIYEPSYVTIVLDISNSMNTGEKFTKAVSAAQTLVTDLLGQPETFVNVIAFNGKIYESGFHDNAKDLNFWIDSLNAEGGTYTQGALFKARQAFERLEAAGMPVSAKEYIVLLSDGKPTYGSKMTGSVKYEPVPGSVIGSYSSSLNRSVDALPLVNYRVATLGQEYDSGERVGRGSEMYHRVGSLFDWPYKLQNFGNSAIDEAQACKNGGIEIYTVGLYADASDDIGMHILTDISSGAGYSYGATPDELEGVFDEIKGQIVTAASNLSVKDDIAPGFRMPGSDEREISWDIGTLTNYDDVNGVYYDEYVYRIVVTNDILGVTPEGGVYYPTNSKAVATFTNAKGEEVSGDFPVPYVNPYFIKVDKTVFDTTGAKVQTNDTFEFMLENGTNVYKGKVVDNGQAVLVPTGPEGKTFTITEENALNYNYIVKVNGQETNKITFPEYNDLDGYPAEDTVISLYNYQIPGSLTVSKQLRQVHPSVRSAGTTASELKFEFELTAPDGKVTNFFLAPNASKTFDKLAWGEYKVVEKADPRYDVTYNVNGADAAQAVVTFGRANAAKQTVEVINTVNQVFVVKAEKHWAEGSVPVDTYLTLVRVNPDDKNDQYFFAPRKVAAGETEAVWSQKDTDLLPDKLVEYNPAGHAYIYKVFESDLYGHYQTPEGYYEFTKGLQVTNYPYPNLTISGRKVLENKNLTEGEFTFELRQYDPGTGTFGDPIATAKNDKDGNFSFDYKVLNNHAKYFLITEVKGTNARMTYDTTRYLLQVYVDQVEDKVSYDQYLFFADENNDPQDQAKEIVFKNTYSPKTTDLTVTKVWKGGPEKHPEIKVQLYRNGEAFGEPVVLKDTNTFTWKDVIAEDLDCKAYTFSVKEIGVPQCYEVSYSEDGWTITNTYSPKTTDLTVTKVWKGGPEKHPEIKVQLYRNDEAFGEPVVLKDTDTYTWKDVVAEDLNCKPYTFSVKEVDVPQGYEASYSKDGWTITNTYIEVAETGENLTGVLGLTAGVFALAAAAFVVRRKLQKRDEH